MMSNSMTDINCPSTSGISSKLMRESGSEGNSSDYEESELLPSTTDSDSVSLVSCPTFPTSENDNDDEEMVPPMVMEPEEKDKEENHIFEGRRIFDVKYLLEQLCEMNNHQPFSCGINEMQAMKEIRHGYYSEFYFKCTMCNKTSKLCSENRDKCNVNLDMVRSAICTGQGFEQLAEQSAIINLPGLCKDTYKKQQEKVELALKDVAWDSMKEAGQEEAKLAIAEGSVDDDGYPLITVVADGSWAKRSYKTNYNSLSGVACIVGFKTKKILFISVRNSYCCICSRNKTENQQSENTHICYKNWSKTATSMEADIIAEGFKKSVEMHGIKYKRLIGDNDSSVMDKISKTLPYGHNLLVEKINCINHICRNYRRRLGDVTKQVSNDTQVYPKILKVKLKNNIERLVAAVQGSVKYRSKEDKSLTQRITDLKADLRNGPHHVFGNHANCAGYFCKHQNQSGKTEENIVPDLQLCGLWNNIQYALNLVINQAGSLIYDVNNNAAECFNSVVAKYIGGKRVNFALRGSYQARCNAAVSCYNSGKEFHRSVHKVLLDGDSPGKFTKDYVKRKYRENINLKRRRLTYCRYKKDNKKISNADEHYGGNEEQPDMDTDLFEKKKDEFMKSLTLTAEERNVIERNTKQQSQSSEWKHERYKRLTASSFGKVCKMRNSTSCANSIKTLLYSTFAGNSATKYGLEKEPVAKDEISKKLKIEIEDAGLFIDDEFPFLAASPDGLINNDGLVEIKCPASACQFTPAEAIEFKKVTFAGLCNNEFQLKRTHNYFYQIQGQLKITKRDYCIFILWTPKGLVWEKIKQDQQFWKEKMESKLIFFYKECLLPELVDSRYLRNLPIRDPERNQNL